jgi:anti-anti-sigma regulatory factor
MPFSLMKRGGVLKLKLEGEVIIRDARALAAALADGLVEEVPVDVETAQLADIDTCILQLLCALSKTARQVTFGDPGEHFLSALERSQLRKALLGTGETI